MKRLLIQNISHSIQKECIGFFKYRFASLALIFVLFTGFAFEARAVLTLPSIPTNAQFSAQYEFSSEYAYRVKLGSDFLESGAIIAYVGNQIRGAQTSATVFPGTGNLVYKVRVHSNSASGEVLTFKYYDTFNDKVYDVTETLSFVADAVPDYLNPSILNVYCNNVGTVSGMLPLNAATDQDATLDLFWQPSTNATKYNLFLWEDGVAEPSTPYRSGITSTSTRVYNLKYATKYHWKIESANLCSSAMGAKQAFTVRELPDLVLTSVVAPDTVLSASAFTVQFTVKNTGTGSSTSTKWYDAVYVSTDTVYDGADKYLDRIINPNALLPGESYTQSIQVNLPAEYTGRYYLFVRADIYNAIPESDNNNNTKRQPDTLVVNLIPLPDVMVKTITANKAVVLPGDSLKVFWNVDNIGDADAIGGWTERVSLISTLGEKVTLSGTPQFTSVLAKGASVARSHHFKLPQIISFSGDVDIWVELVRSSALIEHAGDEANNKTFSDNKITLGSQLSLTIPTTSISESYASSLRCYVSRSGSYASPLTVNLSSSIGGAVNIPASVIIPVGASSVLFNLTVNDNLLLDGNRSVAITGSASGFLDVTKDLSIIDNEVPSLSAVLSKKMLSEGEVINLTVSRDLVTTNSLLVNLSTNKASQWTFDNQATIPANVASVIIPVSVTNDDIAELTSDAIITVSAAGFNSDKDTATITDDDIPEFEFEILTDTISESAGPYATWGVIRRKVDDGKTIRVDLKASASNALYFPATVLLSANAQEKRFNIGAVDNGLVDGYRQVTLTASVHLSSCNCSTTAEDGGVIKDTLVIVDNDGPSLSLTIDPVSLAEGKANAGTLTVRRNTSTVLPMKLKLVHNDASEVSLPDSVTIPAGQDFVSVPVTTLDDGIEDGNQMVTIQAKALGFAPGIVWVFVNDQNKPDLQMMDVVLGNDTAVVTEQLEVNATIINNGYATAPSGVIVKIYLSKDNVVDDDDDIIGEHVLPSPIPAGKTVQFWELATMPKKTGLYKVLVKVNPDATITELLHINNESSAVPLVLIPNYNATAVVTETVFNQPEEVVINGKATYLNGSAAGGVDVDVYILSGGTRRTLSATTDGAGNYSVSFNPNINEAGHYMVGACYPNQGLSVVQDEFDILGMKRSSSAFLIWDIKLDIPVSGTVGMTNLSNVALNKIRFVPKNVPAGFELQIDTIAVLPGAGTADFHYTVTGKELSEGVDYIQIPVDVISEEGIIYTFTLYYYCQALKGQLKAAPTSLNTTMTKGQSRIYELKVYNIGAGETGKVSIAIPKVNWMTLLSSDTIETIESGDTATITIQLSPGDDVPLNAPITGTIVANVANGKGVVIPYRIESVSEAKGGLLVDVVDEYTYFTQEAPHVRNAHVVVRHPFSGKIVAEGFTDTTGVFKVDSLPEGSYKLTVEVDKHEGYQNTIIIDPGRVNEQVVFLSFQAITYTWEVVPTEIEDEYEVELILEYETNVPVPVVIVEMPKVMPQLFNNETYPFLMTLTNKGLITAEDVEIKLPQDDPEYEFVTNYSKMNLLAQQAIQVPVVMRRRDAFKSAKMYDINDVSTYGTVVDLDKRLKSGKMAQSTGPCSDYAITIYGWVCGPDKQWHQTQNGFTFTGRICPSSGVPYISGCCYGGGVGPSRGGPGTGISGPTSYVPSTSTPVVGCDNCLIDLALAGAGCLTGGLASPAINTIGCAKGAMSGFDLVGGVACAGGYIPGPIGCGFGLLGAAWTCWNDPPFFLKSASMIPAYKSVNAGGGKMPPILKQAMIDLEYSKWAAEGLKAWTDEVMGSMDWQAKESLNDFLAEVDPFTKQMIIIPASDVVLIKEKMQGTDISDAEIDAFVARWNSTVVAWALGIYSPTAEYPNIIDNAILEEGVHKQDSTLSYARSRGYSSLGELYDEAIYTVNDQIETGRKSVCASVTISIKQKLTMTREAFEGTLTIFNGHPTDAMEEIKVDLEIKNELGELSNDLFQIDTKALSILTGIDGTGVLNAQDKGSATILFIPEKGAAPDVPHSYSFGGTFSYLDPFTGTRVTKPMFPVTLQVNPSPDLYLHYFMSRDILGDDPLTDPIEPIVPAELGLMIENNGYGAAKNVKIESAQPVIIDNEKGLAIHFELVASNLQGQPKQLGLIDIDFGTIDPKSTKIGQWWFTSDLLGHFVNYEAKVTHLDSRGNPDLSLVSGATLHELIKSVRVYGATDDGINDFLVNEVQDRDERPDAIYVSQGNLVLDVYGATSGAFTGNISAPSYSNTLTVEPSKLGWNYIKLDDPHNGLFKIVSVTRNSDNQIIPLDNAWQTHVTLPDGKEPVYENKFHFVDIFADMGEQTYTVVWKVKDSTPVSIVSIDGAPEAMITQPLQKLSVKFNKEIDPATFTWEDMTLRLQGGDDIMTSAVVINKIDALNYELDLSALTTGNGYYVLTVQAAEIYDFGGNSGSVGKQATWTQFLNVPAIEEFIGLPSNNIGAPFDYMLVRFNLPINESTLTADRFALTRGGVSVTGTIQITSMDDEGLLFRLSGLQAMMALDGDYKLTVDLPNIETIGGEKGLLQQDVDWTIDTTVPEITAFIKTIDGGFDAQHVTGMEVRFSEPISGFTLSQVELWMDALRQPLSQVHLDSVAPGTYRLSQFRLLTYYEGAYKLKINMTGITDAAGNGSTTTEEYTWLVDRTAPPAVQNLHVSPDLGYSNNDGVTSTRSLIAIMDVLEANTNVELYLNDNGTRTLLADSGNVGLGELSIPITFPISGNIKLEAHCVDEDNNFSVSSISLFIDETALQGSWKGAPLVPVDSHPDSVILAFADKILEPAFSNSLLSLQHKGASLSTSSIAVTKMSDKEFKLSGFKNLNKTAGEYRLGVDLSQLHKYQSGKAGESVSNVTWNLKDVNMAPVANAGADLVVVQGGTYWLNGSGSSDPNNDELTYKWYAPDGIVLDDDTRVNPKFKVPAGGEVGTIYTFILSVNDGALNHTDKVDAELMWAVQSESVNENEIPVFIYPVPAREMLYIDAGNEKLLTVSVIDNSGRIVHMEKGNGSELHTVMVQNYASGMYTIKLQLENAVILRKVIIQNP